jgi:hypothetical protein
MAPLCVQPLVIRRSSDRKDQVMAEHDEFHRGPQRRAIPRMLMFIGTIVVIAILILVWFALGR